MQIYKNVLSWGSQNDVSNVKNYISRLIFTTIFVCPDLVLPIDRILNRQLPE